VVSALGPFVGVSNSGEGIELMDFVSATGGIVGLGVGVESMDVGDNLKSISKDSASALDAFSGVAKAKSCPCSLNEVSG
jgi:hypothetical protein